jgi:hypothetical protein
MGWSGATQSTTTIETQFGLKVGETLRGVIGFTQHLNVS